MRSDRNPYFFLKKSKDPQIQQLLKDAETLCPHDIQKMNVKPDVKKAMMFIAEFGQKDKSQHTAELLADKMSQSSVPVSTIRKEIWQYQGSTIFVAVSHTSSIEVQPNSYFLKDQEKIFINHNWLRLQISREQILASSVFHSFGSFQDLNLLKKVQLEQKYSRTLQ